MAKRFYVAYVSNLNVRQMWVRCPGARITGTSEIKDYRLLFKGSKTGSYLTIEPEAGASVPVAVWEVTASDEQALDRYEGYPSFYYKKELVLPVKGIKSGKVRRRTAFVYIMHEENEYGMTLTSQGLTLSRPTDGPGIVIRSVLTSHDKSCFNRGSYQTPHVRKTSPGTHTFFLSIYPVMFFPHDALPYLLPAVPCSYRASACLAVLPTSVSLYMVSVRRTRDLPTPSFRFPVARDTLGVQL